MQKSIRIKYKDLLYWILWICMLQGFISDYFGFHQINYVCDFLLIAACLLVITKKTSTTETTLMWTLLPILLFTLVVIIGWGLNSTPLAHAIWGARNYYRFFLYFIFIIILMDEGDVIKMEYILIRIFPIHIAVVAYQYLVEGLEQDFLSGLFGKTGGGNGGLLLYLSIILCILICRYEYKQIGLRKLIVYLMLIFINAALSELKFLFVLSAFLIAWYLLMSRRKGRGMILALFFLVLLFVGIQIFYIAFPNWANYLNIENVLNLISSQDVYATQTDVGRTAVFSKLTPIISNWGGEDAIVFGIGLGNGDYSSAFEFLNSNFYNMYKNIHYTFLSLGYLFVETGYAGTVLYISFFLYLEIKAILAYQKHNTYYNLVGTFFPIVFLIVIVYNSTLRSNFAYLPFCVLTWQVILDKTKGEKIYDT